MLVPVLLGLLIGYVSQVVFDSGFVVAFFIIVLGWRVVSYLVSEAELTSEQATDEATSEQPPHTVTSEPIANAVTPEQPMNAAIPEQPVNAVTSKHPTGAAPPKHSADVDKGLGSDVSKGNDFSLEIGELYRVHNATLRRSPVNSKVLSFSYPSHQGWRAIGLTKFPAKRPEDLWEERQLQEYVPIQVTTQNDIEWWWFQGEFYQTRFVEGCPSRCLREQLDPELGSKAVDSKWKDCVEYSLNTEHEVEALLFVDDIENGQVDPESELASGVDWEHKFTLNGSNDEESVGYSPAEVAQAAFELKGEQETRAERWKRLQAFKALLDQQHEQYRHELDRRLQERKAQSKTQRSERRREPIPKNVKMYVWQRDGGRCVECGSKERLEYDHIIPLSKGGSNTERNIQLLCERCNRSKGSSIP